MSTTRDAITSYAYKFQIDEPDLEPTDEHLRSALRGCVYPPKAIWLPAIREDVDHLRRLGWPAKPDPASSTFRYVVEIKAEDQDKAFEAICNRLGPDEDYGFPYQLDWFRYDDYEVQA